MKRTMATLAGGFMLLIFVVSPVHALKAIVATIALGEVQVIGIQASPNASISWEGKVVTKSNKLGLFQFSTTDLPQDCVGTLSDGAKTIQVVVSGCTTEQVIGGVLKTGQTQCETGFVMGTCPGNPAGQDGELQKGTVRSYTDNGDGTITDNSTGLVWEKLTKDSSIHNWGDVYLWEDAFTKKIAMLNTEPCFAGQCDWRLPNINELLTLVNYGREGLPIDPVFDNGVDSFTNGDYYWSSTSYYHEPQGAWVVNFSLGNTFLGYKPADPYVVRAVRGGS